MMTWIAGSTLTSTGGFDFQNIPQNFTHLEIRLFTRGTNAVSTENIYARFNADATLSYNGHTLYGDGASAVSGAYTGYDALEYAITTGTSASANIFASTVISILDYANTNKFKTMRQIAGADLNGSGLVLMKSGLWRSTAAINRIYFSYPTFAVGSRADLYGITISDQTGA